uniref:CHK kinase-like domain-containing protein n=1 Tax=Panagrolaimus sp. JU765 TaxID=591449 RepID=A0AC34RJE7_9BILA
MVKDSVDVSKKLGKTNFTAGFLLESLRENDEKFKKLHGDKSVIDIEAEDVSEGKGFVAVVLLCKVKFEEPDSEVYTTVLKIPGTESYVAAFEDSGNDESKPDKELLYRLADLHNLECEFYSRWAPVLEIPIPKVYKTHHWIIGKEEGVLHMEDLTRKGKTMERYTSLNLTQIRNITKQLAHMHKIRNITKHLAHMHKVTIATTHSWRNKFYIRESKFEETSKLIDSAFDKFLKLTDDAHFYEPLFKKYRKFATNVDMHRYIYVDSWKEADMPPVLVHGDFWASNIIWKVTDDGEVTNDVAVYFDWQHLHEGSPMEDLATLITKCCDGHVRRKVEEFFFDFYIEQLTEEMKKDGKDLEEFFFDFYIEQLTEEMKKDGKDCPYSVEKVKRAYELIFIIKVFTLLAGIVFIMDQETKDESERIRRAKLDYINLRFRHALEDADQLLNSDLKQLFEKFG